MPLQTPPTQMRLRQRNSLMQKPHWRSPSQHPLPMSLMMMRLRPPTLR
jgi:hypothetical protein